MAAARGLDLLLGAVATRPRAARRAGRLRRRAAACRSAAAARRRTPYAVTAVSRHEAQGGSPAAPLAGPGGDRRGSAPSRRVRVAAAPRGARPATGRRQPPGRRATGTAGARPRTPPPRPPTAASPPPTSATAARPLLHAALNPSPPLTQRAVGGGIRAMIPLQAALAARAGAGGHRPSRCMGLVPLARKLARKVSPT